MIVYFLVLIQALFLVVQSHSPVYILSQYRQLVTSSALQWVTHQDSDSHSGSVFGGYNGSELLAVCRSSNGGDYLVGQMNNIGCFVMEGHSSYVFSNNFEILHNVDNSARLEWINWKQFSEIPRGSVSADTNLYIAREIISSNSNDNIRPPRSKSRFIGSLNLGESYGTIRFPPNGRRSFAGQILVEVDPIRYDLKSFRQVKIRNIHSSDVRLNKTIEVPGILPGSEAEGWVVNYTSQDTIYFGKGHNLQTGIGVRISFDNGTQFEMKWGLPVSMMVWHKLRLDHPQLPPDSSVTASVFATRIDRTMDYTATLVAHYQDGFLRSRTIQGVYRQIIMDHLRPVFGLPQFSAYKISSQHKIAENIISKENKKVGDSKETHEVASLAHVDTDKRNDSILQNQMRTPTNKIAEKITLKSHFQSSSSKSALKKSGFLFITIVTLCFNFYHDL